MVPPASNSPGHLKTMVSVVQQLLRGQTPRPPQGVVPPTRPTSAPPPAARGSVAAPGAQKRPFVPSARPQPQPARRAPAPPPTPPPGFAPAPAAPRAPAAPPRAPAAPAPRPPAEAPVVVPALRPRQPPTPPPLRVLAASGQGHLDGSAAPPEVISQSRGRPSFGRGRGFRAGQKAATRAAVSKAAAVAAPAAAAAPAPVPARGRGRGRGKGHHRQEREAGEVEAEVEAAREKEALAAQCVEEVKAMLMEVPPGEKKGGVVVPPEWAIRYKPALGPYKRFLEQYPREFYITVQESGKYWVELAPGAEPLSEEALERARASIAEARASEAAAQAAVQAASMGVPMGEVLPTGPAPVGPVPGTVPGMGAPKAPWATFLKEAFEMYAALTPPSKMDIEEFLGPLPAVPDRPAAAEAPPAARQPAAAPVVVPARIPSGAAAGPTIAGMDEGLGPQPEFIQVVQTKYGLTPGSVHQVVGQGRTQWKLLGGHAVPFEQEGIGWHRLTAEEAGPLAEVGPGEAEGDAPTGVPESPGPPWVVVEHPDEPGQYYFYNQETGDSTWEMPGADTGHQTGPRKKKQRRK